MPLIPSFLTGARLSICVLASSVITQSKFAILFGLLKVTQLFVNITQVVVTSCHLYILRSWLFLCNTQSKFLILLSLLKVSQFLVHDTQVVVTSCHLYILRYSLFLCNTQPVKLRLKHNKPPAKRDKKLFRRKQLGIRDVIFLQLHCCHVDWFDWTKGRG